MAYFSAYPTATYPLLDLYPQEMTVMDGYLDPATMLLLAPSPLPTSLQSPPYMDNRLMLTGYEAFSSPPCQEYSFFDEVPVPEIVVDGMPPTPQSAFLTEDETDMSNFSVEFPSSSPLGAPVEFPLTPQSLTATEDPLMTSPSMSDLDLFMLNTLVQPVLKKPMEREDQKQHERSATNVSIMSPIQKQTPTSTSRTEQPSNLPLRRHPCSACPKSFTRRYNLLAHIRGAHSHTRPFKCPQCPLAFARKHDFLRHKVSLHTVGRKPFECPHCDLTFARSDALKRHVAVEKRKRAAKK
ncbi:uncharacterized protein SPPG_07117 [Spizellomyces punctatus DAOM BR117]|uniref:C2H2-type domain-containing protein n=1 Tax=Spizellomyces punctatus (strain DAOM BR117) TaxID=645134 RepID=A0A0L0HAD9_SPIPD|nr:uncharacterized protein SPPG_07117 [Spizellomyces punctatus DAOM BR117]KNC97648.1 hypothetical protein SPPG_07117 [Spizellomyces punctatus DAOM BR117]|eukprot:XP_016605688.1 hypothetical protein SPPG_07117 [Spizellomyces punctatus DAOM BR117]